MTKPTQTPPTHQETEKLIAEFDKWFGHGKAGHLHCLLAEGYYKEVKDWFRKSLTTSFASGRAQGEKDHKEKMRLLLEEKMSCSLTKYGEDLILRFEDFIDALKG